MELVPERLAEQSQQGSLQAFELLVEQFAGRLYHFIRQLGAGPHDAEDLVQETFLKAYESIQRYNPRYSFTTWLFTIAKRTAVDHFRKQRPEGIPLPEESNPQTPASIFEQKEKQSSIWNLARTLPPKEFEALWLFYGEDFSVAETARIMNINLIHAKVLLHRARKGLAKKLQGPQSS